MARIETYVLNTLTGEQELSNVEIIPDINDSNKGVIDLVGGRAIVQSIHAGKDIILTRNQDKTTAIGNLYIYSPNTVFGVSFEIRSTNTLDAGTVFWQIIE